MKLTANAQMVYVPSCKENQDCSFTFVLCVCVFVDDIMDFVIVKALSLYITVRFMVPLSTCTLTYLVCSKLEQNSKLYDPLVYYHDFESQGLGQIQGLANYELVDLFCFFIQISNILNNNNRGAWCRQIIGKITIRFERFQTFLVV